MVNNGLFIDPIKAIRSTISEIENLMVEKEIELPFKASIVSLMDVNFG